MLVSSYSSVDRCDVGDVVPQCGITLTNVQLVVSVYGCRERLDNVIVFPTRFGGTHQDNEYLIGEGMASVWGHYAGGGRCPATSTSSIVSSRSSLRPPEVT